MSKEVKKNNKWVKTGLLTSIGLGCLGCLGYITSLAPSVTQGIHDIHKEVHELETETSKKTNKLIEEDKKINEKIDRLAIDSEAVINSTRDNAVDISILGSRIDKLLIDKRRLEKRVYDLLRKGKKDIDAVKQSISELESLKGNISKFSSLENKVNTNFTIGQKILNNQINEIKGLKIWNKRMCEALKEIIFKTKPEKYDTKDRRGMWWWDCNTIK